MKAIHIKLWRDLRRLRAQVVTIAMVVAIGVAGFVGMFSVHESLKGSRDAFYRDNRLADVFVGVKRAPLQLRERLNHTIHIIMLSANTPEFHKPEFPNPVHDLFLVKPVEFGALIDAVGGLLNLAWNWEALTHDAADDAAGHLAPAASQLLQASSQPRFS